MPVSPIHRPGDARRLRCSAKVRVSEFCGDRSCRRRVAPGRLRRYRPDNPGRRHWRPDTPQLGRLRENQQRRLSGLKIRCSYETCNVAPAPVGSPSLLSHARPLVARNRAHSNLRSRRREHASAFARCVIPWFSRKGKRRCRGSRAAYHWHLLGVRPSGVSFSALVFAKLGVPSDEQRPVESSLSAQLHGDL